MCKCGCDTRVKEQLDFQRRNADLWEQAQKDPRDLSYAEAMARIADEDHDRHEDEVTAFVNRVRGMAA